MSSRKRTLNCKISVKVKCVFNSVSATKQSIPRGSEYKVFAFDNNANFLKQPLHFRWPSMFAQNSSEWYNPQANFQLGPTPPAFMWFAHFSKDIFVSFIYVAYYWHIPLLSTIILSTGNVSVNILTDGAIAFPYSSEWSFLGCFHRAEKGNLLTGKVKRLQLRSFGCMAWL